MLRVKSCELDLLVVCRSLICQLVSMKVTVCGNGNHMDWWLLSVKIAGMDCLARCSFNLWVGRWNCVMEEKNRFGILRTGPCLKEKEASGTETWTERFAWSINLLWPSCPHAHGPAKGEQRRFCLTTEAWHILSLIDFKRACLGKWLSLT